MISEDQITAWAAAGESDTQEFKRATGQRRDAARTLCAMLNHRGGRVLFGVEPDGRASGQQVSDHTLEEIARELREIEPPVFPANRSCRRRRRPRSARGVRRGWLRSTQHASRRGLSASRSGEIGRASQPIHGNQCSTLPEAAGVRVSSFGDGR